MKKIALVIICFIVAAGLNVAQTQSDSQSKRLIKQESKPVKNIILMIGDGMGVSQIYAGMTANYGHLNLEKFLNIGFSKTYSFNSYVTDSGAAATALSTGNKTYDGAIGVNADSIPAMTILEYAENNGKSTGLVVTSSVTHATPASFVAHQKSRKLDEEIASDFLKTDIDVFIGGGLKYFNRRKDSLDLTKKLKDKGYLVIFSPDSISLIQESKIAGLLWDKHGPKISEGRGDVLNKASFKAIEVLNTNPEGFFLMIEGSQIDWGGHDNDTRYIIDEVLDFDQVVGMVFDFAEKDGNTLVIVTADHECGGMSLNGGNIEKGEVVAKYTTDDHTGVMVPVFAYGPGSENFRGVYENTEIFNKMMAAFGYRQNR